MARRWWIAVVAALALAACTSDEASPPKVDRDRAYTAVIRWALAEAITKPPDGDPVPVIYIITDDGSAIDAGTQATVARELIDEANVRFADARDDALDGESELQPVKDGGTLVMIGALADRPGRVEPLTVTLYADAEHETHWDVTLTATTSGVTVTSAQEQPAG